MPRCDIGVIGAQGRLGREIVARAGELGHRVSLTGGRTQWRGDTADVIVDASAPAALPGVVAFCRERRIPLLSTVSGLSPDDFGLLASLADEVPVLRADNLSLGHHLQKTLVRLLAATIRGRGLPATQWHVVDRHPATKRDRPSATAQVLAAAVGAVSGGTVDVDSVRSGLAVCDHSVEAVLDQETLTLSHHVGDRSVYADTAVRAAVWLHRISTPGMLFMDDYFGLPPTDLNRSAARTARGA